MTTKKIQTAWIQLIEDMDADIFGTLKFVDGDEMSYKHAFKIWRKFWRKVDRTVFTPARTNKKNRLLNAAVDRWCFVELGESGTNWHMHFVARSPVDAMTFCQFLNATWATLDEKTSSNSESEITPIVYNKAVATYVTKDVRKDQNEAAGFHCSALCNPKYGYDTLNLDDVERRLKKGISIGDQILAKEAVQMHIARADKRMALRASAKCHAV